MSRFNVYVLVNIKLCVGCDSLSAPKKDYSSFYNTDRNTQIFNAWIFVVGCPNSITRYFPILCQNL